MKIELILNDHKAKLKKEKALRSFWAHLMD